MVLWLCSYVAMWLYGDVAMWLFGYVAMSLFSGKVIPLWVVICLFCVFNGILRF